MSYTELPFYSVIKGLSSVLVFSDDDIDHQLEKYILYHTHGTKFGTLAAMVFHKRLPEESMRSWLSGKQFEGVMRSITKSFGENQRICLAVIGPDNDIEGGLTTQCTFPDIQVVDEKNIWRDLGSKTGTLYLRNVALFPSDFIVACSHLQELYLDGSVHLSHPKTRPETRWLPPLRAITVVGESALASILEPLRPSPTAPFFFTLALLNKLIVASSLIWNDPQIEYAFVNLIGISSKTLNRLFIYGGAGNLLASKMTQRKISHHAVLITIPNKQHIARKWAMICKIIQSLHDSKYLNRITIEMRGPYKRADHDMLDVSELTVDWDAFLDAFKYFQGQWAVTIRVTITRTYMQYASEQERAHSYYYTHYLAPALARHYNFSSNAPIYHRSHTEPYMEINSRLAK